MLALVITSTRKKGKNKMDYDKLIKDYVSLANRYDDLTDKEKRDFNKIFEDLLDAGYDMNTYFETTRRTYLGI
jgi:hypothetical protein